MNAIVKLDNIRSRKERIDASHRRARAAAAKLLEASETQITAARTYRKSVENLSASIKRLENGWKDYDAALDTINVKPLRRNAQMLADMMDNWETRSKAKA